MKKVLVALAMIMGMGTSMAFAHVLESTTGVEQTQQDPQEEFTKIEVKDIPQAVMETLGKEYEGAVIKEAYMAERETDTGGPINSGSNGFIERKGRGHKGII